MARLRGWAAKGERCRAAVPHGHWKTTTFSAGLRLSGLAGLSDILCARPSPAVSIIRDPLDARIACGEQSLYLAVQELGLESHMSWVVP